MGRTGGLPLHLHTMLRKWIRWAVSQSMKPPSNGGFSDSCMNFNACKPPAPVSMRRHLPW